MRGEASAWIVGGRGSTLTPRRCMQRIRVLLRLLLRCRCPQRYLLRLTAAFRTIALPHRSAGVAHGSQNHEQRDGESEGALRWHPRMSLPWWQQLSLALCHGHASIETLRLCAQQACGDPGLHALLRCLLVPFLLVPMTWHCRCRGDEPSARRGRLDAHAAAYL